MSAVETAWTAFYRRAEEIGTWPDGWIIGARDWDMIRADSRRDGALDIRADGKLKLFGQPVRVHGREGVYPTHDAMLTSTMRWFTREGHVAGSRVVCVHAMWQGREIAYSHVVLVRDPGVLKWMSPSLADIIAMMDLAVRRLAFTDETQGPEQ